jgi:hypothetical protein
MRQILEEFVKYAEKHQGVTFKRNDETPRGFTRINISVIRHFDRRFPPSPLCKMPVNTDNGALADYVSADDMQTRMEHAWKKWKNDQELPFVHVCGFHQESDLAEPIIKTGTNLENLTKALEQFLKKHQSDVIFNTVSGYLSNKAGVHVEYRPQSQLKNVQKPTTGNRHWG